MDFDAVAAGWDDDEARTRRTRDVAAAMRAALGNRHRRRALDVGAGTGSLSILLADLFDEIVLVDTSPGMLEVAAAKVAAAGDAIPARITTLVADLAEPGSANGPDAPVDAVYSLMALHHVPDTDALLSALRALLAPGGLLLVADLAAEDGSFHAHHADFDGHDGFDRHSMEPALRRAGFSPRSHETAHVVHREVDGVVRDYPVFLAVAVRSDGPHAG
jgi:ubiquinone/menaquinone biosynthesis C-methylase UbiE